LGSEDPPELVFCDNQQFQRVEIYKHDSWAATARYRGEDFDIVCKFNRKQSVLGLPVNWLGRFLARREAYAYQRLQHIPGIAAGCGPVSDSRQIILPHAVAHHFIPGRPLSLRKKPDDAFFPQLMETLRQVHQAGFAYVDLHKRENVLAGDDGRAYLIDFQVSFQTTDGWCWGCVPCHFLLRALQRMDKYCVFKHVRTQRPIQVGMLGLEEFGRPPIWLRVHRCFAVPLRYVRRKFLSLLRVRDKSGTAVSERFAEHAFRCDKGS
jgi:hypothetical protein